MKDKDFKKLLKSNSPKELIRMHIRNEINLSSKQIENLIENKNQSERGVK